MIIHHIPIPSPLTLTPEPFTREAFAPFGDAISNPRPDRLPSSLTTSTAAAADPLPFGAVSANQGTAIQYRALASVREFYATQAPSREPASPRLTIFVCGARELVPVPVDGTGTGTGTGRGVKVEFLERHPFTSQTFVPLGGAPAARYLVVVAPTLAEDPAGAGADAGRVPVPKGEGESESKGGGLPDVRALRAFVATGRQAVTYAPGTWHAPMMALGPEGGALDFVVTQFANDVPLEDCQEVRLEGAEVLVRVPAPEGRGGSKL
ncbi:ureidoglycolate hydrolase [Biscogniauxia marginata]|nr:ureidoglycolate hydrolase [Biscogniauxia marginata]